MKFALIPIQLVFNASDGDVKPPTPNAVEEAIRRVLDAGDIPVPDLGSLSDIAMDRPHSLAENFPMQVVSPPACIDVKFAIAPRDSSAKIPNLFSSEAAKAGQLWLEEKAKCKGRAFAGAAVPTPGFSGE